MTFWKKEVPKTPIYLPDGSHIQFEPRDGRIGFYQTENQAEIDALTKLEKEHRGGVFSVTETEYQGDKKKLMSMPSNPGWRQEIGGGIAQDTMLKRHNPGEPGAAAAAAAVPKPTPPPAPTTAAAKPPVKPPNVGRRP
jgi:hypothetical protein